MLKAQQSKPAHVGTVAIILDGPVGNAGTNILLGLKPPKNDKDKKRKRDRVGVGCLVPPGGEFERSDMAPIFCIKRETLEECGLDIDAGRFKRVGWIKTHMHDGKILWFVHLFLVQNLSKSEKRRVKPSDEYVRMGWFPISSPPYEEMISGDKKWMNYILDEKYVEVQFYFGEDNKIIPSKTKVTIK